MDVCVEERGESRSCRSPHLVPVGPGIVALPIVYTPYSTTGGRGSGAPERQTQSEANTGMGESHPSVIGWQCGYECLPADGHEKDAWAQPGCHVAAWHRMDGSLPRDLEPLVSLGSSPMVLCFPLFPTAGSFSVSGTRESVFILHVYTHLACLKIKL